MKTHKLIFPDVLWTCFLGVERGLPRDVSLTPKNIDFFTVDNLLLARA